MRGHVLDPGGERAARVVRRARRRAAQTLESVRRTDGWLVAHALRRRVAALDPELLAWEDDDEERGGGGGDGGEGDGAWLRTAGLRMWPRAVPHWLVWW